MMHQSLLVSLLVSSVAFQHVRCATECIKLCACDKKDGILIADCSGLNLTEVPSPEPKYNVNILHLQYNQISTLRMGDFLLYPDLSELYLLGNRIDTIEERTFEGLRSLLKLDLSSNEIYSLPDVKINVASTHLKWLSLAMNRLKHLPEALKNMTELQYLDVSDNKFVVELGPAPFPSSLVKLNMKHTGVKVFSKSAFENLQDLTTLILSDNMASASLNFEEGVFDKLVSVEHIDLSRSFCKKMSRMSFAKLKKLKSLLVNNCWISKPPIFTQSTLSKKVIPANLHENVGYIYLNGSTSPPSSSVFTGVTSGSTTSASTADPIHEVWFNPELSVLDLSNNQRLSIEGVRFPPLIQELGLASTRILKVDNELFNETTLIQKLHLSGARIRTIEENAFNNLHNVTEIDISNNPLKSVPILPPTLHSLELNRTRISNITRKLLRNLSKVVTADFSSGEFGWIEEYAFQDMVSMETLDLSENKIDWIKEHTLVVGTPSSSRKRELPIKSKIKVLNLASNVLRHIEPGAFSTLNQLHTLDLQGNFLSVIEPGLFTGLQRVENLYLNGNSLVDISPTALDLFTNIQVLHLEDNELEVVFSGMFDQMILMKELHLQRNRLVLVHDIQLPSLNFLDISSNNLTTFPTVGGEKLKEIKASQNPIEEIPPGALRSAVNLESFHMSGGHISNMNYSELQHSSLLRYLDLNNNYITRYVNVLLPSLETIYVNDNEITDVGVALSKVTPMISILDLSYNKMTSINPQVLSGATKLAKLNLAGNSFKCDCNLYPLVTWLKHHAAVVVNLDDYVCITPEESFGQSLVQIVSQLTCTRNATTVYVAVAIAVFVLALLLSLLIVFIRRRAKQLRTRERIVSENGEPMRNERVEVRENSTVTCCCFSPKKKPETHGRIQRVESDDVKDLMISSEVTSQSQIEVPTSL